ncbi:MAG: hypothetical protein ACE5HV_16370, partial [Acidobacteriota bacterium]
MAPTESWWRQQREARGGVAVACLLAGLLALTSLAPFQDGYQAKVAEARSLLNEQRLAESLIPLRQALEVRPEAP